MEEREEMEEFTFKTNKGIDIKTYKWIPEGEIKAAVQISHGMNEHILRYDEFASFLASNGYLVYGNDHLGHGQSKLDGESLGYISDEDGFVDMLDEMRCLTDIIKKENPGTKLFMFAHSMGSFLAQRYIQIYGEELYGLILSGTNGEPPSAIDMGISLSKIIIKTRGRRHLSKLINLLAFGSYNKKFKPRRTIFDWISSDEDEVDKYIEDPLCGNLFPASFFHDLFVGMKEVQKDENLEKVPENLPIYIFAGNDDPVGNYGEGIVNLYKTYKNYGVKDLEYKLYKSGRHEMLNEKNKKEVIEDNLDWLERKL